MQRLFALVILLLFTSSLFVIPLHATPLSPGTPNTVDGTAQNELAPAEAPVQIQLSLTSERPELTESTRAEGTFTTFETSLPLLGEPGAPALPVVRKLVGIPAAVAPTVDA
ncbi:MAG: hypothetical protein M3220_06205, partial [Chloroflexota bacterium]|nr:hypothetical protein [Chloroflexota bacterium]